MTAHAWAPAGRMDDGSKRERCAICGACRHWEEAKLPCGAIALEVPHHAPRMVPPDGAPKTRECRWCSTLFAPMSPISKFCSGACFKMHVKAKRLALGPNAV